MARPDLFELRPTWTAPKPNATLLTLEPLTGSQSETLVALLGRVPADAHARIVEAAEGNPLFVEQLVAMQADAGDGELEVPPTLQALLAARIDRLAEPERAVVERGSVEGRLFHRGAVAALLAEPARRDVGGHLLTLVRKELIRPDRAVIPGDDGFRFGHILIRDAAYETIPKRQRATLHERFADWLVSKLGDDAPDEIVGYHLEQAYRYTSELGAPDEALGERAAERLASAGHAARARRDVAATINMLGRAVELKPGGPGRAELLAALGEALHSAGETARAVAVLQESASLASVAEDEHVEWLARIELAAIRLDSEPEGAGPIASREGEAAIEARSAADDHEVLARAWILIGESQNVRGDMVEWGRAIDRALVHARGSGDQALEVQAVVRSAGPVVYGPVTVQEGLRFADDIAERLGHVPEVQALALHVRGHMWARQGLHEGALDAVTEFRRHKRELGQDAMYAMTAGCAWDVCAWAEDWVSGEQVLREGYEMLERMELRGHLSTIAGQLGEAVYQQGRLDEAERLSAVSEDLGSSDDSLNAMAWRRLRAKVLAARGEFGAAMALGRQAVEIAGGVSFQDEAALTWLDVAVILHVAGDEGARTAAERALGLFEQKGNLVGVGRARAFLGDARSRNR
jgi:tetratricopeptide (TPR) repeat protein